MLKIGDENTEYGENTGEFINQYSFWGKVTKVVNESQYQVNDVDENVKTWRRIMLRRRKRYHFAFGHASNDKTHDLLPI